MKPTHSSTSKPTDKAYELLDKPVANPKYGGQTMREVLRRAFLRSGRTPKIKSEAKKRKNPEMGLQFPT